METASGFDVKEAARRMNAENARYFKACDERKAAAKAEGVRLAGLLAAMDKDIRVVWGFGSTYEENLPYTIESDIDLAIEGGDINKLYAIVDESAFSVDLVDISNQDDAFARRVRERGVRL